MKKKLLCTFFLLVTLNCISQTDTLRVSQNQKSDSTVMNYTIPIYSTGGSDAESDLDEQDASSLLQSSRDLFTQYASFQFGTARYRMRGYSAENQVVMINGVNVTNPETGFASWSSWGGLNDVTRFVEARFGNVANRYGSSGPGGYTNIDSKASSFKKGTRVSYATANRVFRHRVMLTHSTGLMKNNWALTLSASARWGNEVYVPGTYFDAKAFYMSLDKKLNDKHLFSFTGFVAPVEKGLSTAATLETYVVSGDKYYNSLWGYQNGKVRNASISSTSRPMFLLSHIYTPNEKRKVSSTIYHTFGKSSLSGLNFNNAANPKPDYYKYLPGYFYAKVDNTGGDAATYNWETDVNTRQINWDELIALNQANLYSASGTQSVNTNETRARYILENRVENLSQTGFNLIYNERKENVFISMGVNAFHYINKRYKEMEDLLGASFWIDVDQFAQNLGVDPLIQQNDIENPNRKIYRDDKFGYDYAITINKAEAWALAEYTLRKADIYGGLTISDSRLWRTGYVANGKFPTTSKGESDKLNFLNYGFKAGGTYKLNGRNFITANLNILSRAPEASNVFISPRVRNDVVDDIKNEEVVSSDINYLAKYPNLKLRFTLYSNQINNQTWLRTYYDDNYNTLVNLIMTNVNQTHRGFELGIEKTVYTSHIFQFVSGFAQSYYSNQPKLQAWQDNNNTSLYFNRRVYLKNYKLGNSPQLVSALGYRFMGKKFWSLGVCLNYFDKIYVEPNPDRRTTEAAGKFQDNEKELAQKIIGQEQIPSYFVLNVNTSKSYRIHKRYSLNLNASINNLLNTKNTITGGYEQLRWDQQQVSKFPNKYVYMTGTTYMLIINFSF
ncbi:TonB-dependent receptor plug domain-containing protein [Aurantibacillus circumpalustris]|uniref:TonB-dependent receptor plug domain-containing protein n=1 Tax=Aurantibacillus circumpalustris TaxID=3036359 RepID=UPI00295BB98B|nr:TonB-dependent receptor plug domain-containing protein [Aurantibacillus circumpalustris]